MKKRYIMCRMKKKKYWIFDLIILSLIVVVICYFYIINKNQENLIVGGTSTYHYFMVGTVIDLEEDNKIIVRPHGRMEDLDFEYKKILHYLEEDEVVLEYNKTAESQFDGYDGDITMLQEGDEIYFRCFASDFDKRPIPINSVELLEYSLVGIQNMKATTIIDENLLNPKLIESLFYNTEISEEIRQRIWNISYKENEQISLEELRYLRVLYRGFDGNTHIGELIVNQSISEDVLEIMFDLYQNDYPIEKMVLIDEYNGDDVASMEDNNTSAFNYRVIAGTNKLSKHGMGLAIDINPKYNPYVTKKANGEILISPESGADYVDRSKSFSYKLDENDLCVKLFLEHGFTWGGNWDSVKDYQHFEKWI